MSSSDAQRLQASIPVPALHDADATFLPRRADANDEPEPSQPPPQQKMQLPPTTMVKYYAIRSSPKFEGCAIFTKYNDCKSYLVEEQNLDQQQEQTETPATTSPTPTADTATNVDAATAITDNTSKENSGPSSPPPPSQDQQQHHHHHHHRKLEYKEFGVWIDAVEYIETFLNITNVLSAAKRKLPPPSSSAAPTKKKKKRKVMTSSSSSSASSNKKSKSSTIIPPPKVIQTSGGITITVKSTQQKKLERQEQFERHFDTNYDRLVQFKNDYGDCGKLK